MINILILSAGTRDKVVQYFKAVSYTHLDVYKRQSKDMPYTAGMLAVLVLLCRMQRGGCSRRGEAEVAVAHADVVSSTASVARSKAVADTEMPKAGHFPLSTASLPALAFALLVMAVFRSNGVIVLVLFLPILFFLVQKSSRKKAVLLAGVVLGAYVLLQSGLNIVLKPESTNAMESLTVPIQDVYKRQPVGSVYFRDIDHDNKKAEYGIFIGEADAAGRGIGSETARLAADYARDVLKLHKLMLRVFADNVGAVKSYQNAGFVQEACLKDEFLQNGVYRDMLLMAILFEENR